MLTFLAFCLLAMVLLPIAGVAIIGALVGVVIWMALFPIRLILKLTFALAPLAAVGLIGWALYKGISRRWSPAL